jgi:uncharacterized membrane protein YgcG
MALRALGGAPPLYVHDQPTCEAMLVSLPRARILGLDCEGEQLSRHGRLCLLQLSTDAGQIFIVDMLAPCAARLVDALRPFLESPQVLKVAHDCRNDADALWHQHRVRLRHVFDTQAAYAVLKRNRRAGGIGGGIGGGEGVGSSRSVGGSDSNYAPNRSPESSDCVSLGSLVRRMLGHAAAAKGNISAQMSEEPSFWARRPLRPSQLRYAASDVAHLLPLHARLLLEMDFVAAGGWQKHRVACTATGAASAEGALMMCASASRASAIGADEAMVAGPPSAAEAAAAESERLRAAVTVRSEAYLSVREQTYGVARAEDIQLHAVLPGLVTNVSRFGLFVQVAEGVVGLVGIPELLGPSVEEAAAMMTTTTTTMRADVSPPSRLRALRTVLAPYDVAQPVTVRVISLRHMGGRLQVGLSLHLARLNPTLENPEQLTQGPTSEDGGGGSGGGSGGSGGGSSGGGSGGGVPEWFWGRVLLVESRRATVGLELTQPFELPLAFVVDAATGERAAGTASAAASASAGRTPGGLRLCVQVGQLLRVTVARRLPGRVQLGTRLVRAVAVLEERTETAEKAAQLGLSTAGSLSAARVSRDQHSPAANAAEDEMDGDDEAWSADAAMARIDAGVKRSWLATWEEGSDDDDDDFEGEGEDEDESDCEDADEAEEEADGRRSRSKRRRLVASSSAV